MRARQQELAQQDALVTGSSESASNERSPSGGPNGPNSSDHPLDALDLRTASDLANEQVVQPPSLWKNVLPARGTSLLVAGPKVGKTTFERTFAYHVATGTPFMQREVTQGTVIMLLIEENPVEVSWHCRLMGAHKMDFRSLPIYIHRGPLQGVTNSNEIKATLAHAIEAYQPALMIIDTLVQMRAIRDMNDYTQTSNEVTWLRDLTQKCTKPCHLMMAHHSNKISNREDFGPGDAVMGSQGIFGAVDTLLYIKETQGARYMSSRQRYRDPLNQVSLQLNKGSEMVVGGPPQREQTNQRIQDNIYGLLRDNGRCNWTMINEATKGSHYRIRQVLSEMEKQGKVFFEGTGKKGDPMYWSLVPDENK
jgi:hypothetical protein